MFVVSELVTNAVGNARSQVTVAWRLGDCLIVEVHDEDSRPPVMQRPDWEALGGRGLWLVDAISQSWGTRPSRLGKIVWARLPLAG